MDFTGKHVGLIGTGSTGIQAAPVIAAQAGHLAIFQRTPNYSVPARNTPMDGAAQAAIKANYAEIRRQSRSSTNGHPWSISEDSALDVPAKERLARYEAAWERGGLRFRAAFKDILTDAAANETASEFISAKIHGVVKDPAVADRLMPLDHPLPPSAPPTIRIILRAITAMTCCWWKSAPTRSRALSRPVCGPATRRTT